MRTIKLAGLIAALAIVGCGDKSAVTANTTAGVADRVFVNGVVYTADPGRTVASALAISDGKISYVGDDAGARELIGDSSVLVDLEGKMILPGLHDMHIHPMGIIDTGGCDIASEPLDLAQIAELVASCIAAEELPTGEWLSVEQWNFAVGNQPTAELKTLRQALDAGAPQNPVILWGNDGHHGAVNSLALAAAVNSAGETVGISAQTIGVHFASYRETIGVDALGEPNGELHETARELVNPPAWGVLAGVPAEAMSQIAEVLAANGITSVQDAASPPDVLALYKPFAESGELGYRLSIAVLQDPDAYTDEKGSVDVDAMVADLAVLRSEYRSVPDMQVETAKIFVDGVLEGNPLNDPPTLPNAAMINAYHQPVYEIDMEAGEADVVGYIDPQQELCVKVRAAPGQYDTPEKTAAFKASNGFYPAQCAVSQGVLEHPTSYIHPYMLALDKAGFKIHTHVIGDRALRTALDGFEMARKQNGPSDLRHSLAHIQVVSPQDYKRVGDLGLYLVFTYAWILPDIYYDLTVNPFIDQVDGIEDIYNPGSYYMSNAYPVKRLQNTGAVLAAGSDAPVDTRDPRPFMNMQQAVTRADEMGQVQNAADRIDVRAILDAYTIAGARLFGHEAITGSLEPGKAADLVVIDQDLLGLEAAGRTDEIGNTRVLMTLLNGQVVFEAN